MAEFIKCIAANPREAVTVGYDTQKNFFNLEKIRLYHRNYIVDLLNTLDELGKFKKLNVVIQAVSDNLIGIFLPLCKL
jgi:hypothetical protein